MEANKYYTPKVEEFHAGFEFEHLEDKIWVKTGQPYPANYGFLFGSIVEQDKVRVKYLDKEDIESLGFKHTARTVVQWFSMLGAFYTPGERHRLTEYKLTYDSDNNELKIEGYFAHDSEGVLFEGIIKNKSELRKLMYQLNILKDEK